MRVKLMEKCLAKELCHPKRDTALQQQWGMWSHRHMSRLSGCEGQVQGLCLRGLGEHSGSLILCQQMASLDVFVSRAKEPENLACC